MLGKQILSVILYGVGLTSIAALVYLAGPLIAIGDYRPLEGYMVREIVILLLVAGVGSFAGWKFWRRKKRSEEIAQNITEAKDESDALVLKDRMKDALATLKSASGGRAGYLYDLPWYILIGPPGAGKTTALVNSGLKFPLSHGATPAAVAGIGGTRYCDWWFTEDAVLIDTAGRYTTQDSDAKADQQSWLAFLDILKKNRPRQPINGVLLAISLEDLMTLSRVEINSHAMAIRARLLELHERLKVDFPVYALFTKADLIAGFTEFFSNLSEQGRHQVWGATFQTSDKKRNMIGEVPAEFDVLLERLTERLPDRLQEEPVPNTRVSLFGFPTQMAALKRNIHDFLNQIFEPTRYHANATLRGFYFTSGTQQGTPIDQLIGALVKSFGAEHVGSSAYSGLGKSYFLTDLIKKVIIGEAAWVSTDRAAVRRARILKAAAYTGIVALVAGAVAVWWLSYARNTTLIDQANVAYKEYAAAAGPLAQATLVADRDFAKIMPALHKLRYMQSGYAQRATPTPMAATFGLSQRERVQSSSQNAYRIALERLFRSRLIYRLEEVLEDNRTNAGFVYEALKVYLMIGGQQAVDRELVLSWWRNDWTTLYPGAANAGGRKELEGHLVALLDLDAGQEPLISLHGPLVEESQRTLARMSVSQRAYALLKSQAGRYEQDWVAAQRGGPDFGLVFETTNRENIDSVRVPGFFTYNGFHRAFIERLGDIAEQVRKERWVLGAAGEQSGVKEQYDSLGPDLLSLYSREFIATWRQVLNKLQLRRLTADKPKYDVLNAASSRASPIKQLLASIRDETALTRERESAKKNGGKDKKGVTPALLKQQGRAPGADIEAEFKSFQLAIEGEAGRRTVDDVLTSLGEIYRNLILLATNPGQAAVANAGLQREIANLRANANRMPRPFSDMLIKAAGQFETDLTSSSRAQLNQELRNQVTGACQQMVRDRYPFIRESNRDLPLTDFGRLFGPGGIIDSFFKQRLEPIVDRSKRAWQWRQDLPLARELSANAIRDFQRAAEIREAFFSTGGSMPSVTLAVIPPALPPGGGSVKMEVHGTIVESRAGRNSPVTVHWPGGVNRTVITVSEQATLGQAERPPATLERTGPWSLFKLLDRTAARRGDRIFANFVVGGQELQYQFVVNAIHSPFNMPALRDFRCPTGL
jgi:type VI secretion system protein ImpL